jgi:hypothetical protein
MLNRTLGFVILCSCIIVTAAPAVLAQQQNREVKAIGCFANVRSTADGHVDGYSINLWSYEREIIGFVYYRIGLDGDAPIGILKDVVYERSAGKISFRAKLTIGTILYGPQKSVPSRDLFLFSGNLKPDRLEGSIILESHMNATAQIEDKREHFLMPRDANCRLEDYKNFEIWWSQWKPVLESSRGPQW